MLPAARATVRVWRHFLPHRPPIPARPKTLSRQNKCHGMRPWACDVTFFHSYPHLTETKDVITSKMLHWQTIRSRTRLYDEDAWRKKRKGLCVKTRGTSEPENVILKTRSNHDSSATRVGQRPGGAIIVHRNPDKYLRKCVHSSKRSSRLIRRARHSYNTCRSTTLSNFSIKETRHSDTCRSTALSNFSNKETRFRSKHLKSDKSSLYSLQTLKQDTSIIQLPYILESNPH